MKKLFVTLFCLLLLYSVPPSFGQSSFDGYEVEVIKGSTLRSLDGGGFDEVSDYHVVQQKQTLYSISRLYGTTVEKIMYLNRLKRTTIYRGQRLLIRRRRVPANPKDAFSQQAVRPQFSPTSGVSPKVSPVTPSAFSPQGQEDQLNLSYHVSETDNAMYAKRRYEEYWGPYKPSLRSVHIGISEFQDKSIPELPYARNDAKQMELMLRKQGAFTFRKVDTRLLLGTFTTREKIESTLRTQSTISGKNDLLVLSVSGHAVVLNNELHILPFDYYKGYRNSITARDIIGYLSETKAKILLLLDVCYSGQAGYDFGRYIPRNMDISVMVSSRRFEKSAENYNWGHGAFTRAFLEGMNSSADINQDRIVSLTELLFYTQARVRSMTNEAQHANCPINFLGDIPLFKY